MCILLCQYFFSHIFFSVLLGVKNIMQPTLSTNVLMTDLLCLGGDKQYSNSSTVGLTIGASALSGGSNSSAATRKLIESKPMVAALTTTGVSAKYFQLEDGDNVGQLKFLIEAVVNPSHIATINNGNIISGSDITISNGGGGKVLCWTGDKWVALN